MEVSGRHLQLQADNESLLKQMLAGKTIQEVEKLTIAATLKKNKGRRDLTAEELGISVRGLQNKIVAYKL